MIAKIVPAMAIPSRGAIGSYASRGSTVVPAETSLDSARGTRRSAPHAPGDRELTVSLHFDAQDFRSSMTQWRYELVVAAGHKVGAWLMEVRQVLTEPPDGGEQPRKV